MDKKKILLIGSIIVIIVSVIASILLVMKKEPVNEFKIDGIDLPQNKEILKDTTIKELDITNVSLLIREGISSYSAKITNNTNKEIKIDNIYVTFIENEKENKILALKNRTLKPEEYTYIKITSESDLSKTTKIEYTLE